ncbi:MAG: creatininase family protein [Chloroflexota bacterium]|nr:creatininase family protein [Chloroflexota bacterium]MDE2839976.1 creatininase family protein [Chloroflexota bacterium]MDE2932157.1 creatininase family protein [Chloroflexota bacterium]
MSEWRYAKLTWPEVRQAAKENKAILLPVAAIEQHGPHLPIDTDNVAALAVCERAAQAAPERILCAPPIHYGFNEHNMDFPGTISVQAQHFIDYCYDVAVSFAHHGFPIVLFVNGHASNDPLLQVSARLATLHSDAACALVSYWDLAKEEVEEWRESEYPGGMDHAGEFETSIYLALDPTRVQMNKAQADYRVRTKWHYRDLMGGSPVKYVDHLSKMSPDGTGGDPTLGAAWKGVRVLEVVSKAIVEVVDDLRNLPYGPRIDHHDK